MFLKRDMQGSICKPPTCKKKNASKVNGSRVGSKDYCVGSNEIINIHCMLIFSDAGFLSSFEKSIFKKMSL